MPEPEIEIGYTWREWRTEVTETTPHWGYVIDRNQYRSERIHQFRDDAIRGKEYFSSESKKKAQLFKVIMIRID